MKLGTRERVEPSVETIVIPRADGELVFKARTVLDWEPFDKLCPLPLPPTMVRAGDDPAAPMAYNTEDPEFKLKMVQHGNRRITWIILESLKATPDLSWGKVDFAKPETWGLYIEELKEFGLNPIEIDQIVQGAMRANALTDRIFDEAKKRFLAGKGSQPLPQTGPNTGS